MASSKGMIPSSPLSILPATSPREARRTKSEGESTFIRQMKERERRRHTRGRGLLHHRRGDHRKGEGRFYFFPTRRCSARSLLSASSPDPRSSPKAANQHTVRGRQPPLGRTLPGRRWISPSPRAQLPASSCPGTSPRPASRLPSSRLPRRDRGSNGGPPLPRRSALASCTLAARVDSLTSCLLCHASAEPRFPPLQLSPPRPDLVKPEVAAPCPILSPAHLRSHITGAVAGLPFATRVLLRRLPYSLIAAKSGASLTPSPASPAAVSPHTPARPRGNQGGRSHDARTQLRAGHAPASGSVPVRLQLQAPRPRFPHPAKPTAPLCPAPVLTLQSFLRGATPQPRHQQPCTRTSLTATPVRRRTTSAQQAPRPREGS